MADAIAAVAAPGRQAADRRQWRQRRRRAAHRRRVRGPRMNYDRAPLAALALTTDSSALTATANDYGFVHIFERQVQALGRRGDVLLGISTSGGSPNVVRALPAAREGGLVTLGFTGAAGGAMAEHCDLLLRAPSTVTPIIQQIHLIATHIVCSLVERALCPPGAGLRMRPATVRQCAVLAGGLGTRLASSPRRRRNRAALRRPALPRLAAARVRPLRGGGIRAAGRPSVRPAARQPPRHRRHPATPGLDRDQRGAGARGHRRRAVSRTRPARRPIPAVQRRFAVRFQPGDPARRRRPRSSRGGRPAGAGRVEDAQRYGVVATEGDIVRAFRERPARRAPGTINAGVICSTGGCSTMWRR